MSGRFDGTALRQTLEIASDQVAINDEHHLIATLVPVKGAFDFSTPNIFISLLIYRLLEHRLPGQYTCSDIIQTLRQMNLTQIGKEGFIPAYTRAALTDALHTVAGFSTDFEFISRTSANKLCVQARQLRK